MFWNSEEVSSWLYKAETRNEQNKWSLLKKWYTNLQFLHYYKMIHDIFTLWLMRKWWLNRSSRTLIIHEITENMMSAQRTCPLTLCTVYRVFVGYESHGIGTIIAAKIQSVNLFRIDSIRLGKRIWHNGLNNKESIRVKDIKQIEVLDFTKAGVPRQRGVDRRFIWRNPSMGTSCLIQHMSLMSEWSISIAPEDMHLWGGFHPSRPCTPLSTK